jgi:hypothetical protein
MIGKPDRRTWNVVVGFFLGGFCSQLLGVACLALYQAMFRGGFAWINLFSLTRSEELFLMAIPASIGLLLIKRKPYVAVGMFLYSGFTWLVSAAYRG